MRDFTLLRVSLLREFTVLSSLDRLLNLYPTVNMGQLEVSKEWRKNYLIWKFRPKCKYVLNIRDS